MQAGLFGTGGVDFGAYQPVTVVGELWQDTDADGVNEIDEDGLDGWVVFADIDGDGELDASEPQ
ncbi:MAG: hypothetical protein ACOC20_07175, partial [Oceanicaulis sp.]